MNFSRLLGRGEVAHELYPVLFLFSEPGSMPKVSGVHLGEVSFTSVNPRACQMSGGGSRRRRYPFLKQRLSFALANQCVLPKYLLVRLGEGAFVEANQYLVLNENYHPKRCVSKLWLSFVLNFTLNSLKSI